MLEQIFASSPIPVLEQVVHFAQARHQVLAGNIANLDTPGYRTRDISPEAFQDRLKEAIEQRNRGGRPASLGNPAGPRGGLGPVSASLNSILRHDDANVGLEQQITEIAKNQMEHNFALAIMNSQFRLLQAAITERA